VDDRRRLDTITRIMPELPLDQDQRNAFVCHFDRVGVPELVRREPTPHTRAHSGAVQLLARGRRFPAPTGRRSMNHTKEGADR
jgi:hypothetical protein